MTFHSLTVYCNISWHQRILLYLSRESEEEYNSVECLKLNIAIDRRNEKKAFLCFYNRKLFQYTREILCKIE